MRIVINETNFKIQLFTNKMKNYKYLYAKTTILIHQKKNVQVERLWSFNISVSNSDYCFLFHIKGVPIIWNDFKCEFRFLD